MPGAGRVKVSIIQILLKMFYFTHNMKDVLYKVSSAGLELSLKNHFAIICRAKRGLQPAAGENFLRIAKQFSQFAM